MKALLAVLVSLGGAGFAAAQDLNRPLPAVVRAALPAAAPAPAMLSRSTDWSGGCQIPLSAGACPAPQAVTPACAPACGIARGSACERFRNWLTFRVCEPNHAACVPFPYHAPLRTYFPYTPAPTGANGPLDCYARPARLGGHVPKCGVTEACATTRPATLIRSMRPTEAPCGSMERSGLFRRMISFFTPEGFGFHRCGASCTPSTCSMKAMCAGGRTCAAPGVNYRCAASPTPVMPAGAPSALSADRPFTSP